MESYTNLPASLDDVDLPEELPPIVIPAFTRPDLLKEVLSAINQQSLLPSNIIALIDGARKPEDIPLIENCVLLLRDFSKIVPTHIIKRESNLGCDKNVILGFTEVLANHNSIVYLEDDVVPNPYFYDRICRLLEVYRECKQICSVSAYATYPAELEIASDVDFILSNRVFCLGMGLWADRWQELDLANHLDQYNPFGKFYNIPATSQTKMTIANQFWLEKNLQTDWVITFTLAALYHHKVHIVPTKSFTLNIGFGHPEAKTYKDKEPSWVNSKYDENFYPNNLPPNLDLPSQLKRPLSDAELMQHFFNQGIWLSPSAFLYLFRRSNSLNGRVLVLKLFLKRLPKFLQRLRGNLPA